MAEAEKLVYTDNIEVVEGMFVIEENMFGSFDLGIGIRSSCRH